MKQIDMLWRRRFAEYQKEIFRYLRYMLNDHILFVLVFAGGAALYYYSGWVKTIDPGFPAVPIMAAVLGLLLTGGQIHTLLKEADKVFLLPMETAMKSYFNKALFLSFLLQGVLLAAVLAAFMPLYVEANPDARRSYLLLLIVILALKAWNLYFRWLVLKLQDRSSMLFDQLVRFLINLTIIYFVCGMASFYFTGAAVLILLAATLYLRSLVSGSTIKWDVLIKMEEARMHSFYRLANLFTDVPHLKGRVKRRQWLDPLFNSIPYGRESTYRFLLSRTFVRANELSGIYARLTLIAAAIILFGGNVYLSVAVSLLFIYLTGIQLLPMIRHHDLKIWPRLYPVPALLKQRALLGLLTKLLIGQALLFACMPLFQGKLLDAAAVAGAGILFSAGFMRLYAPQRLKKISLY